MTLLDIIPNLAQNAWIVPFYFAYPWTALIDYLVVWAEHMKELAERESQR